MEKTAAELWNAWVASGTLRPRDYDADVAEHVRATLGSRASKKSLEVALDEVGWTPRDLLRTLAPLVTSFAGMMRDLLRLSARVGAHSGTGENLRVVFEFDDDSRIDASLSDFRELVNRIELVQRTIRPLVFDTRYAWESPLSASHSTVGVSIMSITGGRPQNEWRFADGIPDVPASGNSRVDELTTRYMNVIRLVVERLAEIGEDTEQVREWYDSPGRQPDPLRDGVAEAAPDYWPLYQAASLFGFALAVKSGEVVALEELMAKVDDWVSKFEGGEIQVDDQQQIDEFVDILALPTWGKRHELYSAWIATQIDRALVPDRLTFIVQNGALRFPFRETLLANLDAPLGDIELWCEVRTPASDLSGRGRVAGIQPDFRFRKRSNSETVAAIEVKQYLRTATLKPASALRDYVVNLPGATVLLVAHGPLGKEILSHIPSQDRDRTGVYRDVRVGRPYESQTFRKRVAEMLPLPPSRPKSIELRWSNDVHDLDLHVISGSKDVNWDSRQHPHATLRADAFNGGPEIVDIDIQSADFLTIQVHLYSASTMSDSKPVLQFVYADGRRITLVPSATRLASSERYWDAATISGLGEVIPSGDSAIRLL